MKVAREWATPLAIGSFGLIAVTGVLMFFHIDSGLNKVVHEWLSWVLVAAVALHAVANLQAFKRYFGTTKGRVIIAVSALLLALSFAPVAGRGEPPFMASVKALAAAPVPTLALVAGVSNEEMLSRLQGAGLQPQGTSDTVQALAGADLGRQMQVLRKVLQKS